MSFRNYEVNHTCQACVQNCSTCTGPNVSNCTSCKDGFYLRASSETACATCHPWCRQCNGLNSDNCTSCWDYSSFEPGVVGKCFCKFRVNKTTCYHLDSRDKCDPRCLECYGPSHRECSSCNSTTSVLKRYNGGAACECLPDYRDSGTCWPCNYECEVCNDNGTCKSCFSWTRMSDTNPGTCLCYTGVRYYPNPDIFICSRCNEKCLTCTGPYENNCTSCIKEADLQPDHTCKCRGIAAMAPDGVCFTRNFFCLDEYCDNCRGLAIRRNDEYHSRWMGVCSCPAQANIGTGLYPDSMTGICHKCGPLCRSCARDTRMCWECKPHSHLSYINPLGAPGFCECDKGYFVSYEYEECLLCQPGCTACKSETECTGCEYGYELSISGGETHCECSSAFCKCPVGFNAISPFDNCEERCHTGFKAQDRKCIATDNTKFVFTPVSIERETVDRSGSLKATFGNPNIEDFDETSPIPIYQNGLFFRANKSAYITITGIDEDLVLGPVHYIELWQKGSSLFSIKRGDGSAFQYNSSSIAIKLTSKSAQKRYSFEALSTPVTTWTFIRYEVQAYKYRQGTRVRMYSNDIQTFEQIVLDYYYRDDAFGGLNSALTIWTNEDMLLGDFVVVNRLWVAELTPACGCAHCTIAGSCLTDCGPMEYLKEDRSCGQCEAACTLGCVRGNDCSRNVDLLCHDYSSFTECRGCKELATLSDGVCGCQEFSSFRDNNNTCTCNVHYKPVEGVCEFVPDPLCRNYTDPPACASCVLLAELVDDFCTCIPHSSFNTTSDSCECDPHYIYNGAQCLFDPLCDTPASDGMCQSCRVLSEYDGNFCQCIANATQSDDLVSCICNKDLKPFENKCIPRFDPRCAIEENGYCTQCKEMASLVHGICECASVTHFDKLTQTCQCEDWHAVLDGSCVYSPDPLCAHLHPDSSCSDCKGLATFSGKSCKCIANATVSADGLSCQCVAGQKPYGNLCITASDPLCTKLDDYTCKACAPLSALINGLCQCIDHAYFYNGTCVCEPLYAEYQGSCISSIDPLCARLSAPEVCGQCKPQATMKNGQCTCVDHSTYVRTNSTCACDSHYAANGTSCDFYPDPLCKRVSQFQECLECKPISTLQNGMCACIDHASTWIQHDQCDCDYHYQVNWKGCEYDPDPLCSVYDSKGKCLECKPAASYQNETCTCGVNTVLSPDRRSCGCLPGFKVYKTKCIPENDPLCTKLEQNECKECSTLSTLSDGVCTCVLHAQFTSKSCTCEPHYALFDGKCVYSTDPLCGELDNKGKCIGCKPQAKLTEKECTCVDHSSYFASNFTCGCDRRYLPSDDICKLDPDPLCANYSANDECNVCKNLSELNSDLCQCVEHAHNTQPNTCVCDTHYLPDSLMKKCDFDPDPLCLIYTSTCLSCKPHSALKDAYCRCEDGYALNANSSNCEPYHTYLLPIDVEAEISEDFSQILTTLAGSVDAKVSCKSIFAETTFAKFGKRASCQWNLERTFAAISLDNDATVVEEDLEFNSAIIIQSQRPCSFQSANFFKRSKYRGKKAPLTANLKAPPIVSLECSNAAVLLDAKGTLGGMGATLKYKWNILHSAEASLYPEYSSYSSQNLISLDAKDLSPGTLLATVTAKDRLGMEDSKSASVELTQVTSLIVEIDVGNSLNLTSDAQASARAIVSCSCGQSGQRTYTWSYEGATPALPSTDNKPTNLLSVSKIPSTLILGKGALTPGFTYIFKVKVSQGSLSGSAQVSVKVSASDLRVRLSRASGSHPADVKFTLSAANSRDPDNSPGDIAFKWACLESNTECKDEGGSPLLTNTTSADIAIGSEKLKVGSILNFTVTISKDSRVSSASAAFTIVESTGITVLLSPFYQKCLRHQYLAVVPKIETKYQTFFKWQQIPDVTITPDSPADASYLAFFAYHLPPGKLYNFEMTATTLVGTMKFQASFYIVSEPEQGVTTVDPMSGREVLDRFALSTTGWVDPDANYPLTYQFCVQLSAEVCLSSPQLSSWRNAKLTAGTYSINAKVYNSLGGLGQSASPAITVQDIDFYRCLVDVSIQESFLSDIEDSEATLGMIAVYSQSLPLDDELFSLMADTLTNYMNSLFEVDLQNFESYLGAVGSMTSQNASRTAANAEKMLTLTNITMERYSAELTEAQVSKVLSLAVALSTSVEAELLKKSALTKFYRNRLPSASPFTFISASLQFATLRQVTESLSAQVLKVGNVSVSIPRQWLSNTNLTAVDIVDLQVSVLPVNSSLLVKVELAKSGEYADYNVQFLEQLEPISLFNATSPFNISLPYGANATGIECVGLDEGGEWSPALCTIVLNKSGVITISTRSVTTYTLRSVALTSGPPAEEVIVPPTTNEEDEKGESLNPTPSVISAVILVAGLITIVLSKKRKFSSIAVNMEGVATLRTEMQRTEQRAEEASPFSKQGVEISEAEEQVVIKQYTSRALIPVQEQSPISCWEFHALIHAVQDRSARSTAPLAFLMMTELVALGLCYTFWSSGDERVSDAKGVFRSYSGLDVVYVAIAVVTGTVAHNLCQLLVRALKTMAVILCGVAIFIEFAGIVAMNAYLPFGPSGRWGEGALWALLAQFAIVETVRAALFRTIKRKFTQTVTGTSVRSNSEISNQ